MATKPLPNGAMGHHNWTREEASAAGKKSAEKRRERKLLVDAVKEILKEPTSTGITKQEAIVAKCLENLYKKGEMRDLKILAELLGENVIKMELKTPQIVVKDEEEKAIVEDLMNVGNEVYEDI